jgi:predicted dehydrogenase
LASLATNDTLQVALIGAGRMGHGDMKEVMRRGLKPEFRARVVAVCDVDALRGDQAKREIQAFYRGQGEKQVAVWTTTDFRELLPRPEIDAVIIASPDHWHGLLGIAAANAGKHIYLEKPLSYGLDEGKALVKAVRGNDIVLQTGSQQRSSIRFRRACEIIRNNWLGRLTTVEVELPTDKGSAREAAVEPPANLDYDLWLGPAAAVPYVEACVHPQEDLGRPGWMQVARYCHGMVTNWGAHMYDIVQWGLGMDDSGPVEVRAKGEFPDRGLWDVHVGFEGEAIYANGVRVLSRNGEPGVRFNTEGGWVYVNRQRYDCSDPDLLLREPAQGEIALPASRNHMEDFLSSARAGRDPICPVETGHRSNTVCLLHHASMKLGGRPVTWDPSTETPAADDGLAEALDVPFRPPWTL